jgi:DNA polymerase III delta subunit
MITILHGEHHVQSRTALQKLLDDAHAKNMQVTRVDGKSLDPAKVEQMFSSQSLFGEEKFLVIDELHSLPKSKKKEELISTFTKLAANSEMPLLLWEKKQLTATELKAFPGANIKAFPLTKTMFRWLDSLTGQESPVSKKNMLSLLQQTLESDGDFFCFAMLSRQVRLLLEAKEGMKPDINPKLTSQARNFSFQQLFSLHKQMVLIDEQQKTSTSALPFPRQLELLLISL